ncbi:E3 ubiquitin-protein ligase UHRF1 isoform X2 [Monomorium pharaonis]|uniref:E3 ubiquitin-protein ligase UHRF1 isoform X2 n=1 Tax=Monomorium pharaonis TaxID=307658 RepID=UPI00174705F2|nr:E3 ubiquitin-protein ligase UHRF1 isoform X2 [Monomorium pharaonis]
MQCVAVKVDRYRGPGIPAIKLRSVMRDDIARQNTREIEKQLHVEENVQRLFFSGKQLEDGYYLHDYNININDVILLMTKTVDNNKNKVTSGKEKRIEEENINEEEELETAESLYYKIGDAVDCKDENTNAWFEAIIKNIYKNGDKILYEISWEFAYAPLQKIPEAHVRPRPRRSIPFDELSVGDKVMINFDIDKPEKTGLWFDMTITEIIKKKSQQQLVGRLHVSSDNSGLCIRKKVKEEIYAIETPKLLTERTADDEQYMRSNGRARLMPPNCEGCNDDPGMRCRSCGCNICAGKEEEDTLLICDECQDMFHMKCLDPPLLELPQETYWYCPECKINENEIVKAGDKLKNIKRKQIFDKRLISKGSGMANAGRQKICYMVPPNHLGPIPGVDVGTTWLFRMQVSEAGVHRPFVAGIHGREKDCAYSIVFSGGYEEDYDYGDEFLYSGSGGRDLSGNKRVSTQSKDQKLTRLNLALAKNCNASINNKIGADAKTKWKEGKPIRVVRNYKLAKFSEYAPKEGNRYDGIYKVVRYYPDKSTHGFVMWKYILRRDDPAPAPWTEEGKARIAFLGLKMIYPDGYLDTLEKINMTKEKKRVAVEDDGGKVKKSVVKKAKQTFDLEDELKNFIDNDKVNAELWNECKAVLSDGKLTFLNCVSERFKCVCCLGILYNPVTTPCNHNVCLKCLVQSFTSKFYFCPVCRYFLGENYDMIVNQTLSSALLLIYPGYKGEK